MSGRAAFPTACLAQVMLSTDSPLCHSAILTATGWPSSERHPYPRMLGSGWKDEGDPGEPADASAYQSGHY